MLLHKPLGRMSDFLAKGHGVELRSPLHIYGEVASYFMRKGYRISIYAKTVWLTAVMWFKYYWNCVTLKTQTYTNVFRCRGVPERLAFVVPIHLPDSTPTNTLTDSSNTALSLFHTVKTRTLPRAPTSGTDRHYFIEREWSSERISLARFQKYTPELYRRSWIG